MSPLEWPAFLWVVFNLFWSMPVATLTGYLKPWKLWGTRNDVADWARCLKDLCRVRAHKLGSQELYRGGPCLYLANHRSWADFFMDAWLTEGRAQMLSRMAVLYAFPFLMIPVCTIHGCIVFKRGSIKDKQGFNAWIDKCMAASSQAGLIVYPEGHRSAKGESLPLKRGMLHYAHSRGIPVQVVITAGKEHVVNEAVPHAGYNQPTITSYGKVVHSKPYGSDFEAFYADLQIEWDAQWAAVFSATPAGLPPLNISPQQCGETRYPPLLMASQVFWAVFGIACMAGAVAGTAWCLLAATAVLGPVGQQVALALLAVWVAASFVRASTRQRPWPSKSSGGMVNGHAALAAAAAAAARGGGTNGASSEADSSRS